MRAREGDGRIARFGVDHKDRRTARHARECPRYVMRFVARQNDEGNVFEIQEEAANARCGARLTPSEIMQRSAAPMNSR